MKGVLLLVLVGLIATGYSHRVERSVTGDVLKEVLKQLDALIEKGQDILKYLTDLLDSGGDSLISKIVDGIQKIIDGAQSVLESAGDCGLNQLDNLINLGKNEIEAATACISSTLDLATKVVGDLNKILLDASQVSFDAATKIVECESKGIIMSPICLAKEAITLVPEIEKIIADLTPVIQHAWVLENDLVNCETNIIGELENSVDEILDDVNKCVQGEA